MNTTNERKPLMSYEDILSMREEEYAMDNTDIRILERSAYLQGALDVRQKLLAKIASGELMVVETVKRSEWWSKHLDQCPGGNDAMTSDAHNMPYCPGCGAKIVDG